MKIAVYGQSNNDITLKYLKILVDILNKKDITIIFEEKIYGFFKETSPEVAYHTFSNYHNLDPSIDLFFS
ncbi:MAG: hypothetical protein KAT78_06585, partial [Flavobacteriaceae bacterium]|nr:hypothetical protein [Flavobacteriaceae bacterium]